LSPVCLFPTPVARIALAYRSPLPLARTAECLVQLRFTPRRSRAYHVLPSARWTWPGAGCGFADDGSPAVMPVDERASLSIPRRVCWWRDSGTGYHVSSKISRGTNWHKVHYCDIVACLGMKYGQWGWWSGWSDSRFSGLEFLISTWLSVSVGAHFARLITVAKKQTKMKPCFCTMLHDGEAGKVELLFTAPIKPLSSRPHRSAQSVAISASVVTPSTVRQLLIRIYERKASSMKSAALCLNLAGFFADFLAHCTTLGHSAAGSELAVVLIMTVELRQSVSGTP
jgi:hypothetical protein